MPTNEFLLMDRHYMCPLCRWPLELDWDSHLFACVRRYGTFSFTEWRRA